MLVLNYVEHHISVCEYVAPTEHYSVVPSFDATAISNWEQNQKLRNEYWCGVILNKKT